MEIPHWLEGYLRLGRKKRAKRCAVGARLVAVGSDVVFGE